MRWTRHFALSLLAISAVCVLAYGATAGSFRGTVIEGDRGSVSQGWLYVRGRDGSIRRVDISHAVFGYDESVPPERRKASAREQLEAGADVRVTAEQGSDGEWRASRVDIVKPASSRSAERKLGSS
jgi:hypothetical protein